MKIIDIAREQVGMVETPINDIFYNTEYYGKRVNGNQYNWCAVFITWLFYKAGIIELTTFYDKGDKFEYNSQNSALANNWKIHAISNSQYYTKNFKIGDIALFGTPQQITHVGIITKVDSKNFNTIEGNSNNKVSAVTHNYDTYIQGVFRPKYYDTIDPLISQAKSLGILTNDVFWNSVINGTNTASANNVRDLIRKSITAIQGE